MKHLLTPIHLVSFLLLFSPLTFLFGQHKQYTVEPTPFSSAYNDFAPMWYKDGLVYCSTFREQSLFSIFKKKTYTLFYTDLSDTIKSKEGEVFSYDLISRMNDGPITFSKDLSVAFFNRNHKLTPYFKSFPDSINPLGIFYADYSDNKWRNIKPFPFNDPHYSLLTPMLSPCEQRLFFASDMPGGFGGTDLYYSDWDGEKWLPPVNLGCTVNTPGNESYPYITSEGKLFFTSDGQPGEGGKDIFFSHLEGGEWTRPINLGSDINTPFDDFGLIINNTLTEGYFTSDRENFDNIYKFKKEVIEFDEFKYQKDKDFCYTFVDDYIFSEEDTTIKYIWRFEEEIIKEGAHVYHCFSTVGKHDILLSIEDKMIKDSVLFTLELDIEIEQPEQPYIDSQTYVKMNEAIDFSASNSHLPKIAITNYFWNFDGDFVEESANTSHNFKTKGEKTVKLGISGFNKLNNKFENISVAKQLFVYENIEEVLTEHSDSFEEFSKKIDPFYKHSNKDKMITISYLNSLNPEKKIFIHRHLAELYKNQHSINSYELINSLLFNKAMQLILENKDIDLEILISPNNNKLSKTTLNKFINEYFNKNEQKLNIPISEAQISNKSNILELVFK